MLATKDALLDNEPARRLMRIEAELLAIVNRYLPKPDDPKPLNYMPGPEWQDATLWLASDAPAEAHAAREAVSEIRLWLRPSLAASDAWQAADCALTIGYLLCKAQVLPFDKAAREGKRSRAGAVRGTSTKAAKAAERREATQRAVCDRWEKNPKLSLSAIQQALAKLV